MLISIETKNFVIFSMNFWNKPVLSRLDSYVLITAAFILLAKSLNLSILGCAPLMFKWIRSSPLLLKASYFSGLNNWGLLKGPGFRLMSPESGSNKGQNESSFLNLNLVIAKMVSSLWKYEALIVLFRWCHR